MFKVIVFSEDYLSSKGICHLLFWEKYGFTVVGHTQDEKQLLSLFESGKPDLLFIDGDHCSQQDRLISNLKESCNSVEIVLVESSEAPSGSSTVQVLERINRRQFTPDNLVRKLEFYQDVLSERDSSSPGAQGTIRRAVIDAAKSQGLKDLLYGRKRSASSFGITLPHNTFVVMLVKIHPLHSLSDWTYPDSFIGEVLDSGGLALSCQTAMDELAFIYNFRDDRTRDSRINAMAGKIHSLVQQYFEVNHPLFISTPVDSIDSIHQAYRQCLQGYSENKNLSSHPLIFCDSLDDNTVLNQEDLLGERLESLGKAFRNRNRMQIDLGLSQFLNEVHLRESLDRSRMRYFLSAIIFLVKDYMAEVGFGSDDNLNLEQMYQQIDLLESKTDLTRQILEISETLALVPEGGKEGNRHVRLIKDYLKEHYFEEISMAEIAREVELTPSYMSTLFKKVTNMTYKEYLIGIRLTKAKELLVETSLPIQRISEEVGYENEHYFSKIFKIKNNVTPSQYRNSH